MAIKDYTVPTAITSLRVAAIPLVLYFLSTGNSTIFLALFLFSSFTDLADGYVARKTKTTSTIGAYYDSIADFGLIAGVFAVLTVKGVYPSWILAIIAISFSQFIITSLRRSRIYDPVGMYFGGFLYVTVATTVAVQSEVLYGLAQLVIAVFFAASLVSRIIFLGLNSRKEIVANDAEKRNLQKIHSRNVGRGGEK
jgi:phosphatidylglycerophosphate synthase